MFKNPPSDLKIEIDKMEGIWRGVCEDNKDPLKAGRIRVRIHGIHSPKTIKTETDGIPVNELPWAEPAFPINLGSVSGIGQWSVPVQGSHVFIFFENNNISRPIYFATVPGIPSEQSSYSNNTRDTSKTDGFKDPDEQYPIKNLLGEPDFNRLARGIKTGTIIEDVNNDRDISVSIAGGGNWSEPSSTYNSEYPYNYVISTESGITIELDSTPNNKRINIYHPKGFINIDNSGNMVVKNAGEKYEIVANGKNIHITDNRNLTVDGSSNKKVGGDEQVEITGSRTETIGGSKTENITGSKSETAASKTENISGSKTETIGSTLNITVTGNVSITTSGTATIQASTINLNGIVNAASQGTVRTLINELAYSIYNSHTHPGDSGGTTGAPNQQWTSSVKTVNAKAS